MFVGHYAIAFGAKKYAPQVSLGFLFLACQLADLIWPSLVMLGIETFEVDPGNTVMTPLSFTHYPYSHSLLALLIWSVLLGVLYALIFSRGKWAAVVIALVAVSHWVLDFLTHRPDMPISMTESHLFGLGLWNFPIIAIPLELLLFAGGVWMYVRQTRAVDKVGVYALWGLVIFLILIYVANVLGPPPPSVEAVAWSAQGLWLVVGWGFWIDRHRKPVTDGDC